MTMDKKPYWKAKPTKKVRERLEKIRLFVANKARTVRGITYLLYPKLHGKALDLKYKLTSKDTVRARTSEIIPWESIKESRGHSSSPDGYADTDNFRQSIEATNLSEEYRRSKRPSHKRPVLVWFEKDTIVDEFEEICERYDIPFACSSGQGNWTMNRRMAFDELTDDSIVLYFGDNDENEKGIEIMNVIERAVNHFGCHPEFKWIMVTKEIERKYDLPKNSKIDFLEMKDLKKEIEMAILKYIDSAKLRRIIKREKKERKYLEDYRLAVVKKNH